MNLQALKLNQSTKGTPLCASVSSIHSRRDISATKPNPELIRIWVQPLHDWNLIIRLDYLKIILMYDKDL